MADKKKRGVILRLSKEQAVSRALRMVIDVPIPPKGSPADAGDRPIAYRLEGGYNGGADPTADHCASWSYGGRTPTADCIGLVLWASGVDRMQPGYKGTRGEWLNCASLLDDAHTPTPSYCRKLAPGEDVRIGDWLLTRDHIGMIVRPACGGSDHLVVDCSPRHGRPTAVNTGYPWSDACEVVRPLVYKEG